MGVGWPKISRRRGHPPPTILLLRKLGYMFFRMVYKSGQIFLPFCHNTRVWQTDRQTDRRTDRILIARPRLHCMQRGKNRFRKAFRFLSDCRCSTWIKYILCISQEFYEVIVCFSLIRYSHALAEIGGVHNDITLGDIVCLRRSVLAAHWRPAHNTTVSVSRWWITMAPDSGPVHSVYGMQ